MKKQLNYKSLNTLGDVDITQSVVPGGGEAEVKDTMEYLDVSGGGMAAQVSMLFAYLWKGIVLENMGIFPAVLLYSTNKDALDSISQIAIDFSTEVNKSAGSTEIMTIKEAIMSLYSVTEEELAAIPRITKEQFYKLPIALTIYGPTEDDAIDYEDKMKTTFDTLWAIWERDGVDGQDLDITIPNADIASVTLINNEGTNDFNITSILGEIKTTTSEIINSIRFNGQYGATLSKIENLITGETTYVYESLS